MSSKSSISSRGRVILITAPSGSGKSTIIRHLIKRFDSLAFSISATTRPPRAHEKHGHDYYFKTTEEFEQMIRNDELLEWEEVYRGRFYGTMKSEVERLHHANKQVLFDIDVRGAYNLQQHYREDCMSLFIRTPELQTLAQRLIGRSTETPTTLRQRMRTASEELNFECLFDHTIVNDDLLTAIEQASRLVSQHITHMNAL